MTYAIDAKRLAELQNISLARGNNDPSGMEMCALEAAAYIAGEPWSDHPACVCPVIAAFVRTWNDDLPANERDRLLRPLIPRLVGTWSTPAMQLRRAFIAADWALREAAPDALDATGLGALARKLRALPEIVDRPTARAAAKAARATLPALRTIATCAARAAAACAFTAVVATYAATYNTTYISASAASAASAVAASADAAAVAGDTYAVYESARDMLVRMIEAGDTNV